MPKTKDRKVWLLTISHRHGANYYVTESHDLALELLHSYVTYWWDDHGNPPKQPKNRGKWLRQPARHEAIRLYFEQCREDESWEIVEVEIITKANFARHKEDV